MLGHVSIYYYYTFLPENHNILAGPAEDEIHLGHP